jgi:hypothetical protein
MPVIGMEEAPCSGTGSFTQGGMGLPSAAATPTLKQRHDESQIQGGQLVSATGPARLAESWLSADAQPGEGTLVAGGAHNLPLHDRITPSRIFQYTDFLNNINSRQRPVAQILTWDVDFNLLRASRGANRAGFITAFD